MIDPQVIERLKLDVIEIRKSQDRTGSKSQHTLRWEGVPANPNGWRLMGDLANDLEIVINAST